MRRQQWHQGLVCPLSWGDWEEDGHGIDVVGKGVAEELFVVSSVPIMPGQGDL